MTTAAANETRLTCEQIRNLRCFTNEIGELLAKNDISGLIKRAEESTNHIDLELCERVRRIEAVSAGFVAYFGHNKSSCLKEKHYFNGDETDLFEIHHRTSKLLTDFLLKAGYSVPESTRPTATFNQIQRRYSQY